MNHYRSHNCSELRASNVGEIVKISGWVHRKRDHGGLLFIDVRDHFGITQCVTDMESEVFKLVEPLKVESVIKVNGELVKRSDDTINSKIPTGEIEIKINDLEILSTAETLPLQVNSDDDAGEEGQADLHERGRNKADDQRLIAAALGTRGRVRCAKVSALGRDREAASLFLFGGG